MIDQIESILEDVDAVINSFLEVGEDDNARALAEEFKEWFNDYDSGNEFKVFCFQVVEQ